MTKFKTQQENFWHGDFGNQYNKRNLSPEVLSSNLFLFSRILRLTKIISSVIEFGAGTGNNLCAIKYLLPNVKMTAVEINLQAVQIMKKQIPYVKIHHQSILQFSPKKSFDLVLLKTILIHIEPKELKTVYEKAYKACGRYLCLVEYYNPTPTEVEYRGHQGFLFKRDFSGEMLDLYQDLRLIDYGFAYRRDNSYFDDFNWFLLEKK